ncbi:MAG: response regulator [bacterium]
MKILIIDDDKIILDEFCEILENRYKNYEIIKVYERSAGINKIIEDKPDIIICDVMMPGIDGYVILKTIKANPLTKYIPFILFSVKAEPEDVQVGLNLGADDYIKKPPDVGNAFTILDKYLKP